MPKAPPNSARLTAALREQAEYYRRQFRTLTAWRDGIECEGFLRTLRATQAAGLISED